MLSGWKRTAKESIRQAMLAALERNGTSYVPFWRYAERQCPICGFEGRFRPFGLYYVRPDAKCPDCGSFERQRLLKLVVDREPDLVSGACLHFAPELPVSGFVRNRVESYVTADICPGRADKTWNIEDIDCDSASFDTILCSHVLEHVDAARALAEFHRVLRPGGRALLMVPICEGLDTTYTNSAATTESERWRHFQQEDHAMIFGRDFRDLVRSAGFGLSERVAEGVEAARYGLEVGERVFVARKEAAN